SVWAYAEVYEADLARVTPGAPVQVRVIAYPERVFPGRIEWMSSVLDPVTRTARLRCPLANPDRALLPEMYATVSIATPPRKALAAPFMVVALAAGLLGLGLWCYTRMDIEAYPNPVAPMIEVITQPAGWSAEEVERYVTIPLENGLAGMIDLEHIRSQSLFGLSDVKCYFSWNPEYHTAQQRVVNRLQFIQLPPGLQPQLSPWSAIGEIFRYTVKGPGYSLAELKTAEDFILERQFRQVPGVVDVVGFGG